MERRRSMKRNYLALLVAGVGLSMCLSGCPKKPDATKPEEKKPEVKKPAEKKAEAPKQLPPWAKALPARDVTAKAGEMVWATPPEAGSEMAKVGVFKVEAVSGKTATLSDKIGTKYPDVPGAVIHPLGDKSKLKQGDVAHGYGWGASKVIGRVTKLEGGKITLKYWWGNSLTEGDVDHAEPLRPEVAPMAWVAYSESASPYKGLCIAIEGEKVWISTDSGHVITIEKSKVKPIEIGTKKFKVGDKAQAYSWGLGYRLATVEKVVEPDLVYSLKFEGQAEAKDWPFSNMVEKL
jgi:hypothetical protein